MEKKEPTWFGKGCVYFSGYWEMGDDCYTSAPVLVFCGNLRNVEDTEGNCRPDICPLGKTIEDAI